MAAALKKQDVADRHVEWTVKHVSPRPFALLAFARRSQPDPAEADQASRRRAEIDITSTSSRARLVRQLAWSPDATELYLMTYEPNRDASIKEAFHFLIPLGDRRAEARRRSARRGRSSTGNGKSDRTRPAIRRSRSKCCRKSGGRTPSRCPWAARWRAAGRRSGTTGLSREAALDAARAHANDDVYIAQAERAKIVGEWINHPIVPGQTFGWGPTKHRTHRLCRAQVRAAGPHGQEGQQQKVNDTKNVVSLRGPTDGTRLAYLEGRGRGRSHWSWRPWRNDAGRLAGARPHSRAAGLPLAAWPRPRRLRSSGPASMSSKSMSPSSTGTASRSPTCAPADFEVRERGGASARGHDFSRRAPRASLARRAPAGIGVASMPVPRRPSPAARVRLRLRHGAPLGHRVRAQPHRHSGLPRRPARAGLGGPRRQRQHARQPDRQRQERAARVCSRLRPPNLSLHRDAAVAADSDGGRGVSDRAQQPEGALKRRVTARLQRAARRVRRERPARPSRPRSKNKSALMSGESARDAQTTLTVLQTLANGLGRFPGPKHVVFFSEGFYTGDFAERVTQVSGLAAQQQRPPLHARRARAQHRSADAELFGEQPTHGDERSRGARQRHLRRRADNARARDRRRARPQPQQPAAGARSDRDRKPARTTCWATRRRNRSTGRTGASRSRCAARRDGRRPARLSRGPAAGARARGEPPPPATPPGTAGSTLPAAPSIGPADPGTCGRVNATETRAGPASRHARSAIVSAIHRRQRPGAERNWAGKGGIVRRRQGRGGARTPGGRGRGRRRRLGRLCAGAGGVHAAAAGGRRRGLAARANRPTGLRAGLFRSRRRVPAARPDGDALAVLRDAARRWPKDAETHNAVGVVLVSRGAMDDAIEASRAPSRRRPTTAPGISISAARTTCATSAVCRPAPRPPRPPGSSPTAIESARSRPTGSASRSAVRSKSRRATPWRRFSGPSNSQQKRARPSGRALVSPSSGG